ncbi:hypothetical protein TSTA_060160 [Talaromyces stipitatus ATCC 10500]|uniref:Uncharacterized protein n=1 Tax=Talaromyces stipitatus (strain ATCC 10500 / CBS 375.48 / QM 6759 / NRRL 1006) TaxID=441959 RepID=B8LU46_TALSN|nr:uncharacterized protein TSTA_060160 [Talaromyces stipitatus ATCC 10500]EED22518.1 hypothetical protein TSTA_060160 [Talaromyces stipitatus ATCC 10500]
MSDSNRQELLREIAMLSKDLPDIEFPSSPISPGNTIGQNTAPLNAPPSMDRPSEPGERLPDPDTNVMEPYGFRYIDCAPPDEDTIKEIARNFDESEKITKGPTAHIEGIAECTVALESGVGESIQQIAQRELRQNMVLRQGPVILGHNPTPTELEPRLAHPRGKDGVSFIRLVRGSVDTADSLKLYVTSHHQLAKEFGESPPPPVQPKVSTTRLFILRGALRCNITPPEGCIFLWVGYSTVPMGDSIRRSDVFPFMVDYRRVPLPEPGSRDGRRKYINYKRTENR